jgi:hypothetical protein
LISRADTQFVRLRVAHHLHCGSTSGCNNRTRGGWRSDHPGQVVGGHEWRAMGQGVLAMSRLCAKENDDPGDHAGVTGTVKRVQALTGCVPTNDCISPGDGTLCLRGVPSVGLCRPFGWPARLLLPTFYRHVAPLSYRYLVGMSLVVPASACQLGPAQRPTAYGGSLGCG